MIKVHPNRFRWTLQEAAEYIKTQRIHRASFIVGKDAGIRAHVARTMRRWPKVGDLIPARSFTPQLVERGGPA